MIDVRSLVGSTDQKIVARFAGDHAGSHRRRTKRSTASLKPGDVVLFHTGHLDKHLQPRPARRRRLADPLTGKSEGWPALGAGRDRLSEAARAFAAWPPTPRTSAASSPSERSMTYWALGSREMVGVEFLTTSARFRRGGYFLFAAVKIRDCHGGPGRAIVLY